MEAEQEGGSWILRFRAKFVPLFRLTSARTVCLYIFAHPVDKFIISMNKKEVYLELMEIPPYFPVEEGDFCCFVKFGKEEVGTCIF